MAKPPPPRPPDSRGNVSHQYGKKGFGATYVNQQSAPNCQRCSRRPGTQKWVGDGGILALSHGMYQVWCEHCIAKAQLKFALGRLVAIPGLTYGAFFR